MLELISQIPPALHWKNLCTCFCTKSNALPLPCAPCISARCENSTGTVFSVLTATHRHQTKLFPAQMLDVTAPTALSCCPLFPHVSSWGPSPGTAASSLLWISCSAAPKQHSVARALSCFAACSDNHLLFMMSGITETPGDSSQWICCAGGASAAKQAEESPGAASKGIFAAGEHRAGPLVLAPLLQPGTNGFVLCVPGVSDRGPDPARCLGCCY